MGLSTGAVGGCHLLVLWVYLLVLRGVAVCWCCESIYLLVLRGIAVCWCCGSIYWCCGELPSVGAVGLSTGVAGGCCLLVLWVSGGTGCISLLLVQWDYILSIATGLLLMQE